MKTLYINKLAPTFKYYVQSQESDLFNAATNTARAMWKRKFPAGQNIPLIQNVAINTITHEIEDPFKSLPDEIRIECLMTLKNKCNHIFFHKYQSRQLQWQYKNASNNGQVDRGKKKNKSQNYEVITSWFCNKKGHTHRLTIGLGCDKTNP
jgi:hypothetical protein